MLTPQLHPSIAYEGLHATSPKALERYLDSRAARFPGNTDRQLASAGIAAWPATAALFVGSDGERIGVYALMKLLGHESMVTSQRYVHGAGAENRVAAAPNPLCGLID